MQTVADGLALRERMRAAEHVLVLTGAGVSAESGVPTFRGGGNTAVWKGMPFDVISSAGMLQRDLPAVWEWFNYRRGLLAALTPNPGHQAIAAWQNRFPDLSLVTQNIDGLHQAAGSRDVIELHGNIWRARCFDCDARYDLKEIQIENGVPSCFDCGEICDRMWFCSARCFRPAHSNEPLMPPNDVNCVLWLAPRQ
jgi:NAD-dependent deacetylase